MLGSPSAAGLSASALAVLAAVPSWWQRRVSAAGVPPGDCWPVEEAVGAVCPIGPGDLAGVPARKDLLDARPEALADAYVAALDEPVRAAHGRHYTPPQLAAGLYRQAVSVLGAAPSGLVWDPACGAGSLLLPALRGWLAAHQRTEPELVMTGAASAVGGRDLDPAGVWLGSILLAAELLPVWARRPARLRGPIPALLHQGDGLAPPPGQPQVVLLNPPYGRVRLTESDRKQWAHVLYGHANLYGLFLAAAVDQVASGGAVSALVPAGWLGGSYFQRLRGHLSRTAPLRHLTYITDRSGVFSTGVLQETVLATYRKGAVEGEVACERILVNGGFFRERIGAAVSPRGDMPWLLPRTAADLPLAEAAQAMPHRLTSYGWTVATGPLVWNRRKPALSRAPRAGSLKVVWAADLDGGRLHQDPSRDDMRYIQVDEARDKALVLDRPAVLVQRTTALEQPRRLLAAILDASTLTEWGGRVVVENHVNVLTPAPPNGLLNPRLLAALLGSAVIDRLYRCLSGSVAVSAYELAALPLPTPETLEEWAQLSGRDLPAAIDAGYGLASDGIKVRDGTTLARGTYPLARSRSMNRCSFPVFVRGSTGRNSIARGYLYGAIRCLT